MEDLLPLALLVLLLGGMAFAWVDWRIRARKIPRVLGPSWDCPHCGVANEAELAVCWSCGAAIARRSLYPEVSTSPETWRCPQCRSWNSVSRKACWSCANPPGTQSKRHA